MNRIDVDALARAAQTLADGCRRLESCEAALAETEGQISRCRGQEAQAAAVRQCRSALTLHEEALRRMAQALDAVAQETVRTEERLVQRAEQVAAAPLRAVTLVSVHISDGEVERFGALF